MRVLGAGLLAMACSGGGNDTPKDTQETASPGPMTHRFSFAIIADPHIAGTKDHEVRLAAAVDWVNDHAVERDIQLVLVLGDIGWGEGLPRSLELLSELQMSWVPIIGDNVVISGQDAEFAEVFADQYAQLADTLEDWERQETPAW